MSKELQFQALERRRSGAVGWLVFVPIVAAVGAAVSWGFSRVSAGEQATLELAQLRAQAQELQQALDERSKLLAAAHADLDLLRTAGQATGVFYRKADDATESGMVIETPGQHGAQLYLYGMVAPAGQGEYVATARGGDGSHHVLGHVLPDDMGNGFLMTHDVPAGTDTVELALRPAGRDQVLDEDIRITARYATSRDERGVLLAQPTPVQARKGPAPLRRRGR